MKYYLITGRIPASETEAERDSKIEIGASNPFDTNGKPFKITYHTSLGITSIDQWKQLLHLYADRIMHTYFVTPEGLRQSTGGDIVPAFHLISMMNEGFAKEPGPDNTMVYFKQRGRIEDETGTAIEIETVLRMMEDILA